MMVVAEQPFEEVHEEGTKALGTAANPESEPTVLLPGGKLGDMGGPDPEAMRLKFAPSLFPEIVYRVARRRLV